MLPRRCDVEYISFSAHADYLQTRSFIRQLAPGHVVLVHGADKEMRRMAVRLKTMLDGERKQDHVRVDTPRNTQSVFFEFLQNKVAKVIGKMADECDAATSGARKKRKGSKKKGAVADTGGPVVPREGIRIRGVLINQNFGHRIMSTNDLRTYTELTVNKIKQRMHVPFWNNFALVEYFLGQVFDRVEPAEATDTAASSSSQKKAARAGGKTKTNSNKGTGGDDGEGPMSVLVEGAVQVTRKLPDRVLIEWEASPTNDMVADACVAVVKSAESGPASVRLTSKVCSHGSGGGGSSAEAAIPLQLRQQRLEQGMRNVLRNTYSEIAVDLKVARGKDASAEDEDDDDFDTALTVVADGVPATVRCSMADGMGLGAPLISIRGCEDEGVVETLFRVTTNVLRAIKMRPSVA